MKDNLTLNYHNYGAPKSIKEYVKVVEVKLMLEFYKSNQTFVGAAPWSRNKFAPFFFHRSFFLRQGSAWKVRFKFDVGRPVPQLIARPLSVPFLFHTSVKLAQLYYTVYSV